MAISSAVVTGVNSTLMEDLKREHFVCFFVHAAEGGGRNKNTHTKSYVLMFHVLFLYTNDLRFMSLFWGALISSPVITFFW